jgi:photosystem II stability/assembly factor-like uncharacterized protein
MPRVRGGWVLVAARVVARAAVLVAAGAALTVGLMISVSPVAAQTRSPVTAADFSQLRGREIGPAGMSGRVTSVDVVLSDPNIVYVGAATGGVWRSQDGGLTWKPIFDQTRQLGVGSVAVFQPNPDILWVGTGEGNPRNSAGVGVGIYKSIDGGETWQHMGLEGSERIHRVVLHPTNPDIAYAGVMGPAWSDGEVRGVYRTTDGGESWERVLYLNQGTGAADLVMDPRNPDKLFAAMWQFRRWPWFFESGGPGSGLYVSHDGGSSWDQLTEKDGLPPGELGRIGLGIAPSDPDIVYALVEATRSALIRSEDGGRSWKTVSDRRGVVPRPFYYADLRVDPQNENRIYSLHSSIQVSDDGGRSFRTVVPSGIIHGDVHELWIDPADGRRMIIGNDGGIAFTTDRGEQWRFVENLPLAQFYHIALDDARPFNVYGGLQDNGSWWGPNTVWEGRGVMNAHWRRVGGGDGFAVAPDLADPRVVYAASQGGALTRVDRVTGRRVGIQPTHPDGVRLRFNWNAAFATDPLDPSTIYLGSQFVHRSRDQGRSWEVISPDLTSNDPEKQRFSESGGLTTDASGAETHTTILSIAPSPIRPGLLWASTDDGRVHVRANRDSAWTDVTANIDGLPAGIWVPQVEPSHHDPAVAYLVAEDHRRGDWTPRIYKTENGGKDWKLLSTNGIDGFVHVIREDPITPNLLFAGTEFGLFVSLDRGENWSKFTNGVPPVPIRDLRIHPRDHDLVLGTHGRAIVVVDDIRPLRALAETPSIADEALRVLPMAPAQKFPIADGFVGTDRGYRSTGHTMQFGQLRPYGALLNYWVGTDEPGATARIAILDASGDTVRALKGSAQVGHNRVTWNLRDEDSREVLAGSYVVRVTVDSAESGGTVEVLEDPRTSVSVADRMARRAALERAGGYNTTLNEARTRVSDALEAVDRVMGDLAEAPDSADALREQGKSLRTALDDLNERYFTGPDCQGGCRPTDPAANTVRRALFGLRGSEEAPTPNELLMLDQAAEALGSILEDVNAVFAGPLAEFRTALLSAGYSPFPEAEPLRIGGGGLP